MFNRLKAHASPAMIVAVTALVVALGGTAVGSVATISALSKKEKKQTRNIAGQEIDKKAPSLAVASANSANTAASANTATSADVAKNVFGESQGVNGSILTPGVTVNHAGSQFIYTFPRSMVNCIPVVTGQFFSGWTAFQSGTAPENQNKITVQEPASSDGGHELVVVCPN
jgi:hypothetical protein